jgi:hypothetical protein
MSGNLFSLLPFTKFSHSLFESLLADLLVLKAFVSFDRSEMRDVSIDNGLRDPVGKSATREAWTICRRRDNEPLTSHAHWNLSGRHYETSFLLVLWGSGFPECNQNVTVTAKTKRILGKIEKQAKIRIALFDAILGRLALRENFRKIMEQGSSNPQVACSNRARRAMPIKGVDPAILRVNP